MHKDTSKSTVLVISMGFLFLYILFSWQWTLLVSICVGIAAILSSYVSQKIEWLWMKLSKLLGYVVPNILLTIIYFLLLYPIALFSKLFKKDPLMLSDKYETYFINVPGIKGNDSFKKTW